MSVQKNFVVRHGLEVNTSLIFADTNKNRVGIATTNPQHTLHVRGGIGATELYVSGVATASAFYGDGSNLTFSGPLSLPGLVVSGVSTLGVTTATNLTLQNLYVSGIGTIISGFVTNFTGVAATITTLNVTNGSVTNLTGTAGTIGSVQISSGIITASSGIVTYYGDGQYLQNILSGVGVATESGLVGTGATILDFRGAGISTVTVASGIATINITGGGTDGTPGGSNTEIQYNNSGVFGGVTGFTYNGTDLNFAGIITATTFVGALTGTASSTTNIPNLTGDITSVNSVTSIAAGVIVNDDINASAGIVDTKLATIATAGKVSNSATTATDANTASAIVARDASGNFSAGIITATTFSGSGASLTSLNAGNISSGTLAIARGGTNATATPTAGGAAYGTGSAYAFTSAGTSGQVLTSNGAGAPSWQAASGGLTISDDTSTNATRYLTFTSATSGSISAENVSTTKLTFNPSTGVLTVVDLNSTSDINLKENIHTVENALETINALRGVSFDWKETGRSSYGVIAQELEEVLPELVGDGGVKSVNYNGIIGVLIEAIKELKEEVEELKKN